MLIIGIFVGVGIMFIIFWNLVCVCYVLVFMMKMLLYVLYCMMWMWFVWNRFGMFLMMSVFLGLGVIGILFLKVGVMCLSLRSFIIVLVGLWWFLLGIKLMMFFIFLLWVMRKFLLWSCIMVGLLIIIVFLSL